MKLSTGGIDSDALAKGFDPSSVSYSDAVDNHRYNLNWLRVFSSFGLKDFQGNPLWVAEKLGISSQEAAEALEGLVQLGLVQRGDQGYQIKRGREIASFKKDAVSDPRGHFAQMSHQFSASFLESDNPDFTLVYFPSSKERVERLFESLKDLLQKFAVESLNSKDNNDAYVFSLAYFGSDGSKQRLSRSERKLR